MLDLIQLAYWHHDKPHFTQSSVVTVYREETLFPCLHHLHSAACRHVTHTNAGNMKTRLQCKHKKVLPLCYIKGVACNANAEKLFLFDITCLISLLSGIDYHIALLCCFHSLCQGQGDIFGGCRCRVNGVRCHPMCTNCH